MPVDATEPSRTARFNLVTQLSETMLDRTLKELYRGGAFQTEFEGVLSRALEKYGITVEFAYDIELGEPSLSVDTDTEGGIRVAASVEGALALGVDIEPRPPLSGSEHHIPVPFKASFAGITKLDFVREDEEAHLELSFVDIPNLQIVASFDVPPERLELFTRLLKRFLLVSLRKEVARIPVSHALNVAVAAGWAIADAKMRIIDGPKPPDFDNVTIAMNTWPNRGRGRRSKLVDWVNPDYDFGMAIDQRFVSQALHRAWQRGEIPRRYDDHGEPDPRGQNEIRNLVFDFQDERLLISVHAARGILDVRVHAAINLSIRDDGFLHVEILDIDAELPLWLRVIGAVALRIAWILVVVLFDRLLNGVIRRAANSALESFIRDKGIRLNFEGQIPGTEMRVRARIEEIGLRENEIFSLGKVSTSWNSDEVN